jgi:hypothetical protein
MVVNTPTRIRLRPLGRYSTTVLKLRLLVVPPLPLLLLSHHPHLLLPVVVIPVEMETEAMEFAPTDSVAPSMVGVVQLQRIVLLTHLLQRQLSLLPLLLLPAVVVPVEMETEAMDFAPMDSVAPSMVGVVQLQIIVLVALLSVIAEMAIGATESVPMGSVAPSMVGVAQLRPIVLPAIFVVAKRGERRPRTPRRSWTTKMKASVVEV